MDIDRAERFKLGPFWSPQIKVHKRTSLAEYKVWGEEQTAETSNFPECTPLTKQLFFNSLLNTKKFWDSCTSWSLYNQRRDIKSHPIKYWSSLIYLYFSRLLQQERRLNKRGNFFEVTALELGCSRFKRTLCTLECFYSHDEFGY